MGTSPIEARTADSERLIKVVRLGRAALVPRQADERPARSPRRFSSLLAKADRILGPDDHALALRLLHNAPVSDLERSVVEEAAVEMTEGFSEVIPCSPEDLVMPGPIMMLRPLCILEVDAMAPSPGLEEPGGDGVDGTTIEPRTGCCPCRKP